MYRIFYGDEIVYDPYVPEQHAFNVTCNGGINDKGTMRFSVAVNHYLYRKFAIRNGIIRFEHDGNVIFMGYIDSITKNLNLELEISCIGELALLGDILIRPYATYVNNDGMEIVSSNADDLFRFYIDKYNEKATNIFQIGDNEASAIWPDRLIRENTGISTVAKEIESQLLDTIGGYISLNHDETGTYINYNKDIGDVNAQIIDFGVNMTDYTYTTSSGELYTALVARGAEDITIESATPEARQRAYEYFAIEGDTLIDRDGTSKYGYKEYLYTNNDCETGDELLEAAVAHLKTIRRPDPMIIVKAVDLSLFMPKYRHLRVGEIARVRSYPHDVDEYMVVTEIDVDLDNPENTEYTLGIVYDTLTGEQSSKLRDLNSTIDKAADRVDNLGQEVIDVAQDAARTKEELEGVKERLEASDADRIEFEQQIKETIKNLKDIADGAIMTWFYNYAPSLYNAPANTWKTEDEKYEHLGDLFYDTSTGYAYRWMYEPNAEGEKEYSWGRIVDTDVQAALQAASEAKDTADSKRRVFYETPYPPYDEGDLWAQGSTGDLLVATKSRSSGEYDPTDWAYASKYNKAVFSTEEWFYQSDSPDVLEGGEWSQENTWVEGKFTWRRTLVTYGDGTSEWQPSEDGICITGNTGEDGAPGKDGPPGEDGVGVEEINPYYLATTKSADVLKSDDGWTKEIQTIDQTKRYLWNYQDTLYTNGRIESTEPVLIGTYGLDGSPGKDGTALSGTSDTGEAEEIKIVKVSDFRLYDGVCIAVYFSNRNTAASPKLKVNDENALDIITNGYNSAYWLAGETVTFVYRAANKTWNVASAPVWASVSTIGNPVGKNVYIDGDGVSFRNGDKANATFQEAKVSLAKNNSQADIFLASEKIRISGAITDPGTGYIGYFSAGDGSKRDNSIVLSTVEGTGVSGISRAALETSGANGMNTHAFRVELQNSPIFELVRQNGQNIVVYNDLSYFNVYGGTAYFSTNSINLYSGTISIGQNIYSRVDFTTDEVYKNDKKILCSEQVSSNSGNGSINLTSRASNYKIFDIYFSTNDTNFSSVRVYNPDTKYVSLTAVDTDGSSTVAIKTKIVYINGSSITNASSGTTNKYREADIVGSSVNGWNYNRIIIQRVEGWK